MSYIVVESGGVLQEKFRPEYYTKLNLLGEGGFGRVHKYHFNRPDLNEDFPENIARKKTTLPTREYKIMDECNHPNLLRMLYWEIRRSQNEGHDKLLLYTELCHQNFRKYLKEHKLAIYDIKYFSRQLIWGLEFLHGKKVVHRDIKPENILVCLGDSTFNTVLKLGDFGLARLVATSANTITAAGTRAYASPEMYQAMSSGVDLITEEPCSTDVFSLGLIIYEMFTRKAPFSASQLLQKSFDGGNLVTKHIAHPTISIVLASMLKWRPEHRPIACDILRSFIYDNEDLHVACKDRNLNFVTHLAQTQTEHMNQTGANAILGLLLSSHEGNVNRNRVKEQGLCLFLPVAIVLVFTAIIGYILFDKGQIEQERDQLSSFIRECRNSTHLYAASAKGYDTVVKLLLENHENLDVNLGNVTDNMTPLYVASKIGHVEIVRLLLQHKPDVNRATLEMGFTPLYAASYNGHLEVVELLLKNQADVDKATADSNGLTPLFAAASNGHAEIAKLLLDHKAEVDKATLIHGVTPLLAAAKKGHVEVVKILLNYNAVVNQASTGIGATPLYEASLHGHTEIVRLLLQHKANVFAKVTKHLQIYDADVNKDIGDIGISLQLVETSSGYVKVDQLLLGCDANVNKAISFAGVTALFVASNNGHAAIVKLLLQYEATQDPTVTGITPLLIASNEGHTAVVQLLLEHKVDVNQADNATGAFPLFVASKMGHAGVVILLLDRGAHPNQVTNDTGETALFAASENGHVEVVKLLLQRGADVYRGNYQGVTPVQVADKSGREEVTTILRRHILKDEL